LAGAAERFPTHPISLIVPNPAGAGSTLFYCITRLGYGIAREVA
jgi:hypothetical protein